MWERVFFASRVGVSYDLLFSSSSTNSSFGRILLSSSSSCCDQCTDSRDSKYVELQISVDNEVINLVPPTFRVTVVEPVYLCRFDGLSITAVALSSSGVRDDDVIALQMN